MGAGEATMTNSPSQTLRQAISATMAAAVIGFVLPWVRLEVRTTKFQKPGARQSAPEKSNKPSSWPTRQPAAPDPKAAKPHSSDKWLERPRQFSGLQIPHIANQEASRTLMQLAETLSGRKEYYGAKSYAVYLVPGIALLFGWLLLTSANKNVTLGVLALGPLIAAVAVWKLLTIDPGEYAKVAILPGLWICIATYPAMAACAAAKLHPDVARVWDQAAPADGASQ